MGYVTEEYMLFRAAKYMGVAAWELEERDPFWLNHALAFENAENQAKNNQAKKEARRSKSKGKR